MTMTVCGGAKDNVLQEGWAKNVTQKNNRRAGAGGIVFQSAQADKYSVLFVDEFVI